MTTEDRSARWASLTDGREPEELRGVGDGHLRRPVAL